MWAMKGGNLTSFDSYDEGQTWIDQNWGAYAGDSIKGSYYDPASGIEYFMKSSGSTLYLAPTPNNNSVTEPASLILLGTGLCGLGWCRRKKVENNMKKNKVIKHNETIQKKAILSKKELIIFLFSWILIPLVFYRYYLIHQEEYNQSPSLFLLLIILILGYTWLGNSLFLKKGFSIKRLSILLLSGIGLFSIICAFMSEGVVFSRLTGYIFSVILLLLSYLLIFAITFLSGKKIISIIGYNPDSLIMDFLFSIGIGFGLLMLLTFGIGITGFLYKEIIYSILISFLVILLIISRKEIKATIQSIIQKSSSISSIDNFSLFLISFFILTGVSCFAETTLLPASWDSIAYHLKIPADYISHHRIIPLIYNFNANTSHNMELLYTLAMLIKGPDLAQLFNLSFFVLSGVGIYSLCRKFSTLKLSLLGVGIFLANGFAIDTITTADVDMGLTFFFLLGMLAFITYTEQKSLCWIVLMGFYAGICLGIKYTGCFCLIALFICLLVHALLEKQKKMRITLYLCVSMLIFLPWMVKNYYFTGNPIYPMLFSIFDGINWSKVQAEQLEHFHKSIGMGREFLQYLLLPWNITIHVGLDYKSFLGKITPLFLMILPAFLLLSKEKIYWYLFIACGVFFACWAYYFQNLRYLVPVFPLLSILCVIGLQRMTQVEGSFNPTRVLSHISAILIVVVMAKEGAVYIKKVPDHLNILAGNESSETYLSKNVQPYEMFQYINKKLPESSKLFFIWENRGFYCKREYISDLIYEASWIVPFISNANSSDKLFSKLKSMHITHILYNQLLGNVFRPSFSAPEQKEDFVRSMGILEEFLGKHSRLVYQNKEILLFEVL